VRQCRPMEWHGAVDGAPESLLFWCRVAREKLTGNCCLRQGKQVPAPWQWVGDVETLVVDITHRTYYVEVGHFVDNDNYKATYDSIDGQTSYASYQLEAHILDNSK